ncbi:MAG: hypothetical protein H6Q68_1969 [Firmicutes bacterium]|nr:hypothetical protein [Bacillota bacterium]
MFQILDTAGIFFKIKNRPLQTALSQHYTPGAISPALDQSHLNQRIQMLMNRCTTL